MAFIECINRKLKEGDIQDDVANEIKREFRKMKDTITGENQTTISKEEELRIAKELISIMEQNQNMAKMRELKQASAELEIEDRIVNALGDKEVFKPRGVREELVAGEALIGMLDIEKGGLMDVEPLSILKRGLKDRYRRHIFEEVVKLKEQTSVPQRIKDIWNGDESLNMKPVFAHLMGEEIELNQAQKRLANGIRKALDESLMDYKLAGGSIRYREDYVPNPVHDAAKISDNPEEWINFMMKKDADGNFVNLDKGKMKNYDTNREFTKDKLREFLLDVRERIIKGERLNGDDPGVVKRSAFRNKHKDPRVLHFTNSGAWFRYMDKFGDGLPFNAVLSQIDRLARDTAIMRKFGPNPRRGKRFSENIVSDIGKKVGNEMESSIPGERRDGVQRAEQAIEEFDSLWQNYVEKKTSITEQNLTNFSGALKSFALSAVGGAIPLTAVPGDSFFHALTFSFNGMKPARGVANLLRTAFPSSMSEKQASIEAAKASFSVRNYLATQNQHERFVKESFSNNLLNRTLPDATMKLSFQQKWDKAAQSSWFLENMRFFADVSDKSWGELAERNSLLGNKGDRFQNALERYGITREEWEILRKAPLHEPEEFNTAFPSLQGEYKILRPFDLVNDKIAQKTGRSKAELNDIAKKMQNFILQEEKFARPTFTDRAQNTLSGGATRPWIQSITDIPSLFKNYMTTVFQLWIPRIMNSGNYGTRFGWLAAGIVGGTMAGALQTQLSSIASRRNPRPMDITTDAGKRFWGDAFLQGTGLSPLEYIIRGNQYGGSLAGRVIGPVGELLDSGFRVGRSGVEEGLQEVGIAEEDKTGFGGALSDFIDDWMPLGNIWWAEPALQHGIKDPIRRQLDPNAQRQFNRKEEFFRRKLGQTFYQKPGGGIDEILNTPDITTAIDEPPIESREE